MIPPSHLEMGAGAEFDAIRGLLVTWGAQAAGIGDDAAVLAIPAGERLVVSTDASVENVHFRREWMTAEEIGGRAAAAALSDLAAMGATPRGLLLALNIPELWRPELEPLARGVGTVAASAGCPIIGGNVSAAGELSLTITVLGSAVQPLTRSGARDGDIIFVTGRLGGSGAALRALLAGEKPAVAHRARFVAPVPRLREARWLAEHGAHAVIDISDGLLADASHLARASGVSLSLDERAVPCVSGVSVEDALASGEEYELLVAVPPASDIRADEFEREFGLPLTAIGVVSAPGASAVTLRGSRAVGSRGHDHLS
ncbi:MAG TPA: thiamine-phosphate kinase [Coriobacteriia bacterium]